MKITKDNYKVVPQSEEALLLALLEELESNDVLPHDIEIHWQSWHDEYSPERVDPCPDFYGTYAIKWEGSPEYIARYMSVDDLDDHLCTLFSAFEQLEEIYETNS